MRQAWLAVALCAALASGPAAEAQTEAAAPVFRPAAGAAPEVVDGDTLWIGIHELRLKGVDAVEAGQTCRDSADRLVDCFSQARSALAALARLPGFHCVGELDKHRKPRRSYGRYVAVCHVGAVEVNALMVDRGWAFAASFRGDAARQIGPCGARDGEAYLDREDMARKARRGVHALVVDSGHPCAWRRVGGGSGCPPATYGED